MLINRNSCFPWCIWKLFCQTERHCLTSGRKGLLWSIDILWVGLYSVWKWALKVFCGTQHSEKAWLGHDSKLKLYNKNSCYFKNSSLSSPLCFLFLSFSIFSYFFPSSRSTTLSPSFLFLSLSLHSLSSCCLFFFHPHYQPIGIETQ